MFFWIAVFCVWPILGKIISVCIHDHALKKAVLKEMEDPCYGRDPQWTAAYHQALRELNEGLDPDEERLKREIDPPKPTPVARESNLSAALYHRQSLYQQLLGNQHQNAYNQQLGAGQANAQGLGNNVLAGLLSQQGMAGGRPVCRDDPASIIDKLLGGNKH